MANRAWIGDLFAWPEPREVFADLVEGLLAGLGRVNGWQLSVRAGHATPDRVQKFLNAASWSADVLRDRVWDYVIAGASMHSSRQGSGEICESGTA